MIELEIKLKVLIHQICNVFVRLWYVNLLVFIILFTSLQKILEYPLLFFLFLFGLTEKLNDQRIDMFGMSLAKTVYKQMITKY